MLLIIIETNITLMPKTVEVVVGQNIKLECQVNINIPSNMTLSWNGPIRRESVSVVNETSVSNRLEVPAIESYNGQECPVLCLLLELFTVLQQHL